MVQRLHTNKGQRSHEAVTSKAEEPGSPASAWQWHTARQVLAGKAGKAGNLGGRAGVSSTLRSTQPSALSNSGQNQRQLPSIAEAV